MSVKLPALRFWGATRSIGYHPFLLRRSQPAINHVGGVAPPMQVALNKKLLEEFYSERGEARISSTCAEAATSRHQPHRRHGAADAGGSQQKTPGGVL
ncbi:MAG: hypothetical protein ABSG01_14890 [Anaerolineales bacterium]